MKSFTVLRSAGAVALAAVLLAGCGGVRPPLPVVAAAQPAQSSAVIRVEMRLDDVVVPATLQDTAAARDFTAMLPVTLRVRDRFGQAIIGVLPRRLDVAGDAGDAGDAYGAGDIAYWPGGGELAVFYAHDGKAIPYGGLIRLGRIETGLEVISSVRETTITIRPRP